MRDNDSETLEIELLLEGILRRYGYDFRNYARSALKRRVTHRMRHEGIDHISDLSGRMLRDESLFAQFLGDMSICVTSMFRDPEFFRAIRDKVASVLKKFPFAKIWHAGCASGEEAYSMAILLHEEGLLERCHIYATDFNNRVLEVAKNGVYPLDKVREYAARYHQAGAKGDFADYFHASYGAAKMHDFLKERITFANHNLVVDRSFGDMNVIVCRNVLIYFDPELQNRVLTLFADSLAPEGFLCLGSKETIEFSSVKHRFEAIADNQRIYRARPHSQAHGRMLPDMFLHSAAV